MEKQAPADRTRYSTMSNVLKALFLLCTVAGVIIAIFAMFGIPVGGKVMMDVTYYFLLMAMFSTFAFILLPARKKDVKVQWYDLLFAALTFGITIYFSTRCWEISLVGWVPPPDILHLVLGAILCLLLLEGARRGGGSIYFALCALVAIYPLVADHMPGMFWGVGFSVPHTVGIFAFGGEGILGLASKVMGKILIGFLVFAAVLIASGAGRFFLNLALALLGRFRGGPAKVAVVASAFFGSLSGSAVSNVVATGSVTIPTMKRIGYPPEYAGAIEACASTGGVLMPPIMGAAAFVMASFLNIPYATVIAAAVIPSILYYLGLLLQVDAYAAKVGLRGLPREGIPSLRQTLKEGWPFIAVFVFLLWGLLYMRWEAMAPWYGCALMILLSFFRKETMLTPRRIVEMIAGVGRLVIQTMAVIIPIGFIVAGLIVPGFVGSFTATVVSIGGENVFIIMLLGVGACYLMGMGGLMVSAYVFLAITLAPAVIAIAGLDTIAVHLFIVYYSMLAVITPPVALGPIVAAQIAGASPMKTAVRAMRLGVVIYFVPFFFVFNPALVLRGPPLETLYLFALCVLGIFFLAQGMEGYLLKIGKLDLWMRPPLVTAGILIAFPEWKTTAIGAALALFVIVVILLTKRMRLGRMRMKEANNRGGGNVQ